jgi:signal transduction histidine kinase
VARALLPSSVRARATLAATLVVAMALTGTAVVLLAVLRGNLLTSARTTALVRATDIANLASTGQLPATVVLGGDENGFVQVVDSTGRVLASSANVRGKPPVAALRLSGAPATITTRVSLPSEPTGRFVVVGIAANTSAGPVAVYSGSSLETADQAVAATRAVLLVGVPLLVVLVAVLTWLVVARALSPVEAIRRQVAAITAGNLHRRVPEPAARDEIGRLATTMNAMLDRLDRAVERQRDFVADASHELRSPLATLRTELEVALAHPDGRWEQTVRDALTDVGRIEKLAGDLLLLARLDAAPVRRREAVHVAELVAIEIARLPIADRERCAHHLAAGITVNGDPSQLSRLIRNLLDNAIEHAVLGITVVLRGAEDAAELSVSDDGPGIAPADRERVFNRFTRLDEARSRDDGGTGLGLAIAQQITQLHAGRLWVADTTPGATFILRLPRLTPDSSPGLASAPARRSATAAH